MWTSHARSTCAPLRSETMKKAAGSSHQLHSMVDLLGHGQGPLVRAAIRFQGALVRRPFPGEPAIVRDS